MSRIGKLPVAIAQGVTVTKTNNVITVKGPKGEINVAYKPDLEVTVKENEVIVERKNEIKATKAMHGAIRNEINNAVEGVTKGFNKTLQLIGTGYRVALQGKNLNIIVGYSHPVIQEAVEGIEFKVDGQDKIIISGANKELVGQVAANIRAIRPPEPYKGKGIKYIDEVIIKKAGKTSKGE
jgi:large subunit ribosomal protein L6